MWRRRTPPHGGQYVGASTEFDSVPSADYNATGNTALMVMSALMFAAALVVLVVAFINGVACWDINKNWKCDLLTEDINGDGKCSYLDCQGSACWDLNANLQCDLTTEDLNSDDACNTTDCQFVTAVDSTFTSSPIFSFLTLGIVHSDDDGVLTSVPGHYVTLLATATQNITSGSYVRVNFDTNSTLQGAATANVTNGTIILGKTGLWLVTGTVAFMPSITGVSSVQLYLNAATVAQEENLSLTSGTFYTFVRLAYFYKTTVTTDFFQLRAQQSNGTTVNIGGTSAVNYNRLSAAWLAY